MMRRVVMMKMRRWVVSEVSLRNEKDTRLPVI
jgi:hypothetical protein